MARIWRLVLLVVPIASAIPSYGNLFPRQDSRCGGDANLTPCGNGFPADFCCGESTRCVPLNNTRILTTICCPNGRDCARIQPIACNITLQDAKIFPQSPIHTLNLTQELPRCGNLCCPAGFRCDNNECAAINDKQQSSSARPSTATPIPSSLPASGGSTAISTATSRQQTSTTTPTAIPIETPTNDPSGSFSAKSFAAGFVPGILLGAALLFGIIFILARRRRNRDKVTEITSPRGSSGGLSSAKVAFSRRSTRRQISDPVVQPQFSTRTDFYHSSGSQKQAPSGTTTQTRTDSPNSHLSPEKSLPTHNRNRSSSFYDTNTFGAPTTPYTSSLHPASLFHQTPTPAPSLPPLPPSSKASTTPPFPLRQKKSQGSLRRQLSRFRAKTDPTSPSRTNSKRRRVGSWSSGDDRSLSGDERGGRESRGTIRVVMSPPDREPLPMGFGPVLRANMPPGFMQQGEQGMRGVLPQGMAYGHTDLPYPMAVQGYGANTGEKRRAEGPEQGKGYVLNTPPQVAGGTVLGSPYTPSKVKGQEGPMGSGSRETTFGEMMERAGVQAGRRDLDRARGPLYGA
ncbi:hypothetical protein CAC42_6053 [Sphaceloma murrayae]|uniref:Uncharacterized protein n=1 Tax=Sphaceloma murrayae TaxID=2082308 RepID=A0A2K1QV63_9PEZI|nr:hypothetical protein CAC42_6053 [Sphaceloma murrayae]